LFNNKFTNIGSKIIEKKRKKYLKSNFAFLLFLKKETKIFLIIIIDCKRNYFKLKI